MSQKKYINEWFGGKPNNLPGIKGYLGKDKDYSKIARDNLKVKKDVMSEIQYVKDSFIEIGQLINELEDSVNVAFGKKKTHYKNKKKGANNGGFLSSYENKFEDIRKTLEDINFTYKVFVNFDKFFNSSKCFKSLGSKKGNKAFSVITDTLKAIAYSISIRNYKAVFGEEKKQLMREWSLFGVSGGNELSKFKSQQPYFKTLIATVGQLGSEARLIIDDLDDFSQDNNNNNEYLNTSDTQDTPDDQNITITPSFDYETNSKQTAQSNKVITGNYDKNPRVNTSSGFGTRGGQKNKYGNGSNSKRKQQTLADVRKGKS